MHNNQVEIILSKDKISEIIKAYNVLGDFLGTVLPRELLYKKTFQQGLESALKEVELGKSQRVHSFDERALYLLRIAHRKDIYRKPFQELD